MKIFYEAVLGLHVIVAYNKSGNASNRIIYLLLLFSVVVSILLLTLIYYYTKHTETSSKKQKSVIELETSKQWPLLLISEGKNSILRKTNIVIQMYGIHSIIFTDIFLFLVLNKTQWVIFKFIFVNI